MQKEDILAYIRQNKSQFRERFHIVRIGLFGSFARDEQTEHSDIDLIIELEEDTLHIYELKQALRDVLESKFNRPVEIAREKYLKPYAKNGILSEAMYV